MTILLEIMSVEKLNNNRDKFSELLQKHHKETMDKIAKNLEPDQIIESKDDSEVLLYYEEDNGVGGWQTRYLTTGHNNVFIGHHAGLSNNQITLPAGTYKANWNTGNLTIKSKP